MKNGSKSGSKYQKSWEKIEKSCKKRQKSWKNLKTKEYDFYTEDFGDEDFIPKTRKK